MADPNPNLQTKPHFPISKLNSRIQQKPIKQGKSCSDLLIKILFLALFIVVIPLFPSQAPDFLNQTTILTKLWELLHLLFIGIAVAYGLFSRRNVDLETVIETQSSDDTNNTPSYVSKMFPASNIFGDVSENQNLYGFDEKKMMQYWNPGRETSVDCSNRGTDTVGVFDEQCNTQFPVYDDSFDYSVRFDGNGTSNVTNVVQAWNSEYYHSEPVVVAQPYYGSVECDEVVGHKPLGLPVRSLKLVAREVDGDGPKFANEIESDSSFGSRGLDRSKDREFGDVGVGPSSLEKLFNDADAGGGLAGSAYPIPWNSRGRRMEREKRYGNVTGPSHFRPLSVDETKFEALGSSTLQSTTSYSSHTSMYSSFDSISSENIDFQVEEMRQKEPSYVPSSENMNFQEKEMGRKKTSYVAAPENMIFQEDDMEQRKTDYVSASDNMNFQEKETGRRKTSYVPAPENMIFQEEDIEQRKTTAYVPASENTSFQKRGLGKKISKGLSLRRMRNKGKYADVSHPSHLRPMSVDETQSESLNMESFQSAGMFSSHKRMYSSLDSISSDNADFQEEDIGQEKTSENMSFHEEEDMEHKETSYVHATENVNFQEEELGEEKTSYVPASEDMNFQDVDLLQKISQVSSRNGMMDNRGNYAADSQFSNFRPISVDEIQHESLRSRSFQSMGSFSSQTSLRSRSSVDSVSSENTNSLQEGLGEKKSLHGTSSSSSPSPSTRRNGETSLQPFQDDLKNDLNDEWKGISGIGGEDSRGSVNKDSGIHGLQSSDSDKSASVAKTRSRGKSVRTRRANGLTSGTMKIGETSNREADEKVAKKPNNVDTVIRKDNMKSGEPDLLIKGIGKKSLELICPKPEVSRSNRPKRDKLEPSNSVSKESSDEDVVSEHVNDSGLDSEVDKKASEFIAKFKAQIRLQKMDSFDRSKGQKIFGKIIR